MEIEKNIEKFLENNNDILKTDKNNIKIQNQSRIIDISKQINNYYIQNNVTDKSEIDSINNCIDNNGISSKILVSIYLVITCDLLENITLSDKESFTKLINNNEINNTIKKKLYKFFEKYIFFLENKMDSVENKIEETKDNLSNLKIR
jgi:hypothetical protein